MKPTWKILKDSFFSDLYQKYGLDYIENAGFFFDNRDETEDLKHSVNILCTPFGNLNPKTISEKTCVLLATGCFAPIHHGHIEMMKSAKIHLESLGWNVANGYISPDHDEYITQKCNDKSIGIFDRIGLINQSIKDEPWLFVDPWAGVFNTCAINYTDVITRLSLYLKHHFKREITVFFVCGSDNARFSMTFENKGQCVVVNRPGIPKVKLDSDAIKVCFKFNRVHFASGNVDCSSTEIRKTYQHKKLFPRELTLISNGHELESNIVDVMTPYFKKIDLFRKNQNIISDRTDVINLDKDLISSNSIEISRHYDFFGDKLKGYGSRPGSDSLDDQCKKIAPGMYYLLDSDITTGGTTNFVKQLLKKYDIEVSPPITLLSKNSNRAEILDAEDFILDGGEGLVVSLPDKSTLRVPYILPYVNCGERCSTIEPIQFSIDIWELNRQYFKMNPKTLDEIETFQDVFLMAGFDLEFSMEEICQCHIEMLEKLK